ncbi:NYN domain-containing protein [Prosthecomicrobium pneumaticum]|uniref:NYN domain-containing protein n=1 Tax=Prosthecomicrobium pneumaticum TaxID=81895 RepID=A0A7W9L3V5_9HYPH|nr:NYN domain-containing protein [Prosthecomicrobium pneumaticum]MBB5754943.1 hypothetical protein [Prosthecomicrobium pneumaticum]
MASIIKSVLFVDYDSIYLSLRSREPGIARRFASRPGVWVDAIERGELIDPPVQEGERRRVLLRRCYADPKLLGSARSAFAANGFQVIDCSPLPGRERNASEVNIALDVVDALAHSTSFDEFIILSADTDFTPLIIRLRAHARMAAIYATPTTALGYRAIADGTLDENGLVSVLAPTADAESPEVETEEAEVVRPGIADREELAALARRVHNATNVPLLSPKVFGELFRALAAEVSENGYHFQATAENVAARLAALGRNTSRRQIAFVVKGLALRGHVFSGNDSPDRLAEVFIEQVLYLTRAAGIELDDDELASIRAWIQGRTAAAPQLRSAERAPRLAEPAGPPAEPPRIPEPPQVTPPLPERPRPAPVAAAPQPAAARPVVPPQPQVQHPAPSAYSPPQPVVYPAAPSAAYPPQPAPFAAQPQPPAFQTPPPAFQPQRSAFQPGPAQPPAATQPPPQPVHPPQPVPAVPRAAPRPEPQRPAALIPEPPYAPEPPRAPAPPRPQAAPPRPVPPPQPVPGRAEEPPPVEPAARPVSEIAPQRPTVAPPRPRGPVRAVSTGETSARSTPTRSVRPANAPNAAIRPPARRTAPPAQRDVQPGEDDPIETSILAAIAEAVDVLVEEEQDVDLAVAPQPEAAMPAQAPQPRRADPPAPQPQPELRQPQPVQPQAQPEPDLLEEEGDIGEEIQRILSVYSQSRKPPSRP